MKKISENIMTVLCEQGIISSSDLDKYIYGMDILLSSALEVLSIIALSALCGNFFQTVLFFAAFIPLRIFAGGYHASTRVRCYFVSLAVYAVFTMIIRFIPADMYSSVIIVGVMLTLLIVWMLAPIINENKKLNINEVNAFRKFSIMICMAQGIVFLMLNFIFKNNVYLLSAVMGDIAVAISMLVAAMKDKIKNN